jgi:thiosulfate/3-mercaptopyruvate sulfurtransferase
MDLHKKGMAMQTPAFVAFRYIRQPMGSLDMKSLKYFQCSSILVLRLQESTLYDDPVLKTPGQTNTGIDMLPLITEPEELQKHLGDPQLLIIDLCKPDIHAQGHLPGAQYLDYSNLIFGQKPAPGQVPDTDFLVEVLSELGLDSNKHVVAYDDEGSGKACRLLWTLDLLGHKNSSLLNGGLHSWAGEDRPLVGEPGPTPATADFKAQPDSSVIADKDYILANLENPNVRLLDARSIGEFDGVKVLAARGGHIPGAVNFEWLSAIDYENNMRMKPVEILQPLMQGLGIEPDKEIITYCQTHHRSAHSYIMLKAMGYEKIRGYLGSWSDWGNDPDTPIE